MEYGFALRGYPSYGDQREVQGKRIKRHILEKIGFSKCGAVIFQGGEKLAYDKKLRKGTVR